MGAALTPRLRRAAREVGLRVGRGWTTAQLRAARERQNAELEARVPGGNKYVDQFDIEFESALREAEQR